MSNETYNAISRLIEVMAEDYGEQIASVAGRQVTKKEAIDIGVSAAVALTEAVASHSQQLDKSIGNFLSCRTH